MKSFHLCSATRCAGRESDLNWINDYLIDNSYHREMNFKNADYILLSTCALCTENEKRAISSVKYYYRHKKKSAILIILGCLSKINPQSIRNLKIITVSPDELNKLDDIINPIKKIKEIPKSRSLKHHSVAPYLNFLFAITREFYHSRYTMLADRKSLQELVRKLSPTRIYGFLSDRYTKESSDNSNLRLLEVARGCSEKCAYCATRFAIGKQKSKPLSSIISEFSEALNEGYSDFKISADNLGSYGRDIDSSITILLRELVRINGNYSLTLTGLNPREFIVQSDGLLNILEQNKQKFKQINVPVQSGSASLLKAMNRPCNIGKLTQILSDLKRRLPHIELCTVIIVGLPGETEEDFDLTLKLLKTIGFSYVFVHTYSKRPNTPAAKLKNQVPQGVMLKRLKKVVEIQSQYGKSSRIY